MRDRLERFVEENRDAFDELEPRSDLWLDISLKVLDKEEVSRPIWFRQTFWRYAAAVIILLSVGVGIFQLGRYTERVDTGIAFRDGAPAGSGPRTGEGGGVLHHSHQRTAAAVAGRRPSDTWAWRAISAATWCRWTRPTPRLKRDLYKGTNKEQIVDAMIQNLQMRSEIINRQIQTLNQIRTIKEDKKADEKINI
jgi:hypothetical protein